MLDRSWALLCALALPFTACTAGNKLAAESTAPRASTPGYYGAGAVVGDSGGGDPSGGNVATQPTDHPGLGTTWGESVWAPVTTQPFERASIDPWATALLYYNDAQGVDAQARYLGGSLSPLELYPGDGSIGVSVVDASGALLPGFNGGGRTFVVGHDGDRYRLVVRNGTGARFEIVASVDGLDVIDGKPADPGRRGYILEPYGSLVIDGFRQSDAEVAAFRFGAVGESYAAQTSGDRNVGVIGVAIFAEKGATWSPVELERRDSADPFPARGYATPPG
jgi:hypothetical protein